MKKYSHSLRREAVSPSRLDNPAGGTPIWSNSPSNRSKVPKQGGKACPYQIVLESDPSYLEEADTFAIFEGCEPLDGVHKGEPLVARINEAFRFEDLRELSIGLPWRRERAY